MRDLT